jgi:hypothetical protein
MPDAPSGSNRNKDGRMYRWTDGWVDGQTWKAQLHEQQFLSLSVCKYPGTEWCFAAQNLLTVVFNVGRPICKSVASVWR